MIRKIVLLEASLALTLGPLEIGVRIFRPVGSERQPTFRTDETIGWVWAPNQHGLYQMTLAEYFLGQDRLPMKPVSVGGMEHRDDSPLREKLGSGL